MKNFQKCFSLSAQSSHPKPIEIDLFFPTGTTAIEGRIWTAMLNPFHTWPVLRQKSAELFPDYWIVVSKDHEEPQTYKKNVLTLLIMSWGQQ